MTHPRGTGFIPVPFFFGFIQFGPFICDFIASPLPAFQVYQTIAGHSGDGSLSVVGFSTDAGWRKRAQTCEPGFS